MPGKNLFSESFLNKYVTLILKEQQTIFKEEEELTISTPILVEGLLLAVDVNNYYLGDEKNGIYIMVSKENVNRLVISSFIEVEGEMENIEEPAGLTDLNDIKFN